MTVIQPCEMLFSDCHWETGDFHLPVIRQVNFPRGRRLKTQRSFSVQISDLDVHVPGVSERQIKEGIKNKSRDIEERVALK